MAFIFVQVQILLSPFPALLTLKAVMLKAFHFSYTEAPELPAKKNSRAVRPRIAPRQASPLIQKPPSGGLVTLNLDKGHKDHEDAVPGACKFFQHARQSAIAEERERIARDLHDSVGQAFTGALLQMDIADELLSEANPKDCQEAREHIIRARRLVSDGLDAARRSILGLHFQSLKRRSLGAEIRRLVRELTRDTGIRTTFSLPGPDQPLAVGAELQLLRIIQEAITNIVRHAHATAVQVRLAANLHRVSLIIGDNGRGFDLTVAERKQGFGLRSMKDRAAQMGGYLVVRSQPGSGTQIDATVPITIKLTVDEDCA